MVFYFMGPHSPLIIPERIIKQFVNYCVSDKKALIDTLSGWKKAFD